jgi:hypothetical protein
MNLTSVLGVAVLSLAVCTSLADTVPGSFRVNKAVPDGQITGFSAPPALSFANEDFHTLRDLSFSGGYTDFQGLDFRQVSAENAPSSLLGSFNGLDQNGPWKLFLTDVDFGQEGARVQWGLVVTAIPEPSTMGLMTVCGLGLAIRSLRRKPRVQN